MRRRVRSVERETTEPVAQALAEPPLQADTDRRIRPMAPACPVAPQAQELLLSARRRQAKVAIVDWAFEWPALEVAVRPLLQARQQPGRVAHVALRVM